MPKAQAGKVGPGRALLLLVFTFLSILHGAQSRAVAAAFLLGNGSQTNHLLILFAPGQVAQYELRHDGSVQTGAQLLTSVIQATGGLMLVTQANDEDGQTISFSSQAAAWNGQGLFAHFYRYSFGMFVNGFAAGSFAAAADGSWTSYFTYQIAGEDGAFIAAPVGASDRTLAQGDHDAYVLTDTHPSPGLAAWCTVHAITDLGADSDGDGLDHLLEYALRKHPHEPDSHGAIQSGTLENNGETFLTLSYRRPHDEYASVPPGTDAGFDGIGYTVETSTDLIHWQSGTNHVAQTVTADSVGPMVTVVARVPADLPRRFLRLKVFLP